jgi:hypothetical protein
VEAVDQGWHTYFHWEVDVTFVEEKVELLLKVTTVADVGMAAFDDLYTKIKKY